MRCPKCARDVAEGAPVCPACDFILDTSFLSDVLDDPTTGFALPSREGPAGSALGADALILGNLEEEFDSFLSDATGTFAVKDGSASIVPANVFVDRRTLEILKPESVLALQDGALARLGGVERRVAQLLDGKRPVARVWKKSALSKSDLSVALAMLVDKRLLRVVGTVAVDGAGEVVFDEDDGEGEEVFVQDADAFDDATEFGHDLPGLHTNSMEVASEDPALTPEDLAALAAIEKRDAASSGPSPWEDRTSPVDATGFTAPPPTQPTPPPAPVRPPVVAKPAPPPPAAPPPKPEKKEPTRSGAVPRGIAMADGADVTGRIVLPVDLVPVEREASGLRPSPYDRDPEVAPPRPPAPLPPGRMGLPGAGAKPAPPKPKPAPAAEPPPPRPRAVVEDAGAPRPFARKGGVVAASLPKAEELYELALKDRAAGNLSRGSMYAKMALEQAPHDKRYQDLVAQYAAGADHKREPEELKLFQQAQRADEKGDHKKAVELLRRALELAPQSAGLHNQLGVILATRLKDYDAATHHLMQACDLDPKNGAYKNNLGKVVARGSTTSKKEEGGGLMALLRRKLF